MKDAEQFKPEIVDLSSFDFASLASTIERGTHWRIVMSLSHYIDTRGNIKAPGTEGSRPVFALTCIAIAWNLNAGQIQTRDDGWRWTDESIGLPTSAFVLK